MAFPTTGVLDNFNRTDEGPPLSANWTTIGGDHAVVSNQVAGTAASDSLWDAATFGPDMEVFVTVPTLPSAGVSLGLELRLDSTAANGYDVELFAEANLSGIYRKDDNAYTRLGAKFSTGLAAGNKIGLEAIGSTLTAYLYSGSSWSSLASRTDSTHTSAGYILMYTGDTNIARLDDFGGGTVVTVSYVPRHGFVLYQDPGMA